jgi:adenylate cyclase
MRYESPDFLSEHYGYVIHFKKGDPMTAEQKVTRKLRAIMSADVKGYSILMADDEVATVQTLKDYRNIMSAHIEGHGGRVVDAVGDNLLAEFDSAVDAVECAVEVQKELKTKNQEIPVNKRLEFRIGINIGDVIQDGDSIFGDGVNIAARIEGLADAGGVCVSRNVYNHIKKKLSLGYEFLGEHPVKNISEPVSVYKVLIEEKDAGKLIGVEKKTKKRAWFWAPAVALVLAIVGLGIWQFYLQRPTVEVASVEKMEYPLPEKPSIAVLPFDNMSGDPEQEYFCDGLTEEIITALSKVPQVFVIARNSVFTYKGKPVKVNQVAEELGIRYVLEGSVRKDGDRLRITAQLIDALSGHHLWAERYDRALREIFTVQDELTKKIITAMQVELTWGEQARVDAKGTDNLQAYLKFLQAREKVNELNIEGNALGKQLAQEAIDLDPQFAMAYRILAAAHRMDVLLGISKSPKKSMGTCIKFLNKAIELDETYAEAYGALGFTLSLLGQHDKAVATAEKAVALYPNSANTYAMYGHTLRMANRPEEAITAYTKAIRLNPIPPSFYLFGLGLSYSLDGQYEKGVEWCEKAARQNPNDFFARIILTAVYSMAGRDEEARAEGVVALRINPKYSIAKAEKRANYKYKDKMFAALRKAGLPEHPPLPLPDKPSIAVLAFDNLSGDPEQEYFSDGISEEIISALSKTNKLFVIARNSSFVYKGKPVDVKQVSRELGVRYVLEGSVRKSDDRVRITAQLIDATTGHHLWSERYDRDLKDIFALQDEITLQIVTALEIKLTEGEQARMWGKHYKTLDVFLKRMEAHSLWREGTVESHMRHAQVSQEIIDMAPESPRGYHSLGYHYWWLALIGKSPRENIKKAFELAQTAISKDESDPASHELLASVYLSMRQYDKAIATGQRAIELDPNSADVYAKLGQTLSFAGRPDEAIGYIKKGIRLNPFPESWYFIDLGRCYTLKGQYEKALTEYKKALQRAPKAPWPHMYLATAYSLLDQQEEARASAEKCLGMAPFVSVGWITKISLFKNEADLELIIDAMRKAGFPEGT